MILIVSPDADEEISVACQNVVRDVRRLMRLPPKLVETIIDQVLASAPEGSVDDATRHSVRRLQKRLMDVEAERSRLSRDLAARSVILGIAETDVQKKSDLLAELRRKDKQLALEIAAAKKAENEKIRQAETDMIRTRERRISLQSKLGGLEREVARLEGEAERLEARGAQLARAEADLSRAEADLARADARLKAARSAEAEAKSVARYHRMSADASSADAELASRRHEVAEATAADLRARTVAAEALRADLEAGLASSLKRLADAEAVARKHEARANVRLLDALSERRTAEHKAALSERARDSARVVET